MRHGVSREDLRFQVARKRLRVATVLAKLAQRVAGNSFYCPILLRIRRGTEGTHGRRQGV